VDISSSDSRVTRGDGQLMEVGDDIACRIKAVDRGSLVIVYPQSSQIIAVGS
jgi:hypothetical protein